MAAEETGRDPKLKLFIRLPRERFTPDQEESIKNNLFDLLGDTPVKDFEPHINKGYCFLHFEDRLTAAIGHDKIFNQVISGYTIRPFFGFTRTEQRAVDAGIKDEEIERNHRTVYIRDLPTHTTQEEVEAIFKQHGEVAKVNVVKTRSGAAAFVLFQKFTPAMQCLTSMADGVEIGGQTCRVELSKNKNLQRRIEKFTNRGGGFGGGFGHQMAPARGGYGGGRGGGMNNAAAGWGQQGGAGNNNGPWGQYWAQWANWAQSQGGAARGGGHNRWAPWMNRGGRGGHGAPQGNRGGPRGGRGCGYARRNNPY